MDTPWLYQDYSLLIYRIFTVPVGKVTDTPDMDQDGAALIPKPYTVQGVAETALMKPEHPSMP